ncbi:hypothetical protein EVAR_27904_1 [Eumeta japonica]|uniref:Uncharacterized protein n=1 Tax=Eumeta variegata TaxID=151549 RepID=A0A4C1UUY5_EUMVA|nr:hypothetical protein EVAR_27904_1 [Eumeta japonica]
MNNAQSPFPHCEYIARIDFEHSRAPHRRSTLHAARDAARGGRAEGARRRKGAVTRYTARARHWSAPDGRAATRERLRRPAPPAAALASQIQSCGVNDWKMTIERGLAVTSLGAASGRGGGTSRQLGIC